MLEVVVCFAAAAAMAATALNVKVDPLQRTGQVSGLASIQLRYVWLILPMLAALILAARLRGGAWFAMTSRLFCAALAGFATGFVAAGLIVALRGTSWCLNANGGDMSVIVGLVDEMGQNPEVGYPHPFYPPLFPHLLRWYMNATDLNGYFAMQHMQIVGTALFGPAAYLSWRLLLRPGWALGIGVVASLPLIESYKPYSGLTLVILIPVLIKFIQYVKKAALRTPHQLAKAGVVFGVVFGVLLLLYSGWFRWCAPGAVMAGLCVAPWRNGKARAALLIAITFGVFVIVTWGYWTSVTTYIHATAGNGVPMVNDDYIYFDVRTDPAYVAMWRTDLPGPVGVWPPHGELAGIGAFMVLLLAGLATAIAVGRRRTVVITVGCVLGGAWLLRFWYAHFLWQTKLVQLYPRTTSLIVYCLILLTGFAVYYVVEHVVRKTDPQKPIRTSGMIGAACALALLFGMAGSAIADRYMPTDAEPRGLGWLTWVAHDAHHVEQRNEPQPDR